MIAPAVRPALRANLQSGQLDVDMSSIRLTLVPDVADGRATFDLGPASWNGQDTFLAKVPPAIEAGTYVLDLRDPLGRHATLDAAFVELGPDVEPPTIMLSAPTPNQIVGEGSPKDAQIVVDDGYGSVAQISWQTSDGNRGNCNVPPDPMTGATPNHARCTVTFVPPPLVTDMPPQAPFTFSITASDIAGNESTLDTPLVVAKQPRITSFAGPVGGTSGYQPFVVHGRYFLPGTVAYIDGVLVSGSVPGGTLEDDQTITGLTPPHRAGSVPVQVQAPAGSVVASQRFMYVAAPRIRDVQPTHGRAAGGTLVTVKGNDLRDGVGIWFGPTREAAQPLANTVYTANDKVVGCTPPGAGPVSLWANDPITGEGELSNAFTYDPPGAPDPGPSPECQGSGP